MPNSVSVREADLSTAYPEHSQKKYHWNRQERTKRKDQPWRRLATVNKIAQVKGWNLPTYREERTITELLKKHGEYAYLTGKHLGTYYLSTLDIDIWRTEFPKQLITYLEKSVKKLVKFLQTSYDKTKRGLHVDILTPEPLNNETIYWTDKLGKKWNIGSIQSTGKYVVGEDPNKAFFQNGKWYWKDLNKVIKSNLNKFFFNLGKSEQKPPLSITQNPQQPVLFNSLIIPPKKYTTIQAKILGVWETNLEKIYKISYLDKQQHKGYFLLNDYQRENVNLTIGSTQNILLVNGRKHRFFSRLI